jgi:hypothetical protein
MNTLLLDTALWDLCKDANGNIAMATAPYALAQDVASAIKTFLAEVYYDDTLGIDYKGKILGKTPPISLFQEYMTDAALTVPGVVTAVCVISSFVGRTITGQVQFTDSSGNTQTVGFTS